MNHVAAIRLASLVATASFSVAQCGTITYLGFHQENVGASLSSYADEALFGHNTGWNCGFFTRYGDDYWRRTQLMGGAGAGNGAAWMGNAVAFHGDVAVLGDSGDSSTANNGAACIWERSNGDWSRTADLYSPIGGTSYGASVAVSPDQSWVAVGAPLGPTLTGGRIYLYAKQAGAWALQQTIDGATFATPLAIGLSIALADDKLFFRTAEGIGGSVQCWQLQGNTWSHSLTLSPNWLIAGANFGWSVGTDGTMLAIGAPAQSGTYAVPGRVFVYDMAQPGWQWSPQQLWPTNSLSQSFGFAVDVEGSRLAIGGSGDAYEFRRQQGTATWSMHARATPPTSGYSSYYFGRAVALYSRGVLVGDVLHDDDPWNYPQSPGGVHAIDLTGLGDPLRACRGGVALDYGGQVPMQIDMPAHANKNYHVLGSISGFGPSPVLGASLPLSIDSYTDLLLQNPTLFVNGIGQLDGNGHAEPRLVVPSGLPLWLSGLQLHHAAVVYDATSAVATNAVTSELFRIY